MAKVEFKNIKKSFGDVEVVKEFDFTVGDGEFVVFLGPSGCGKTTLLRAIAGLDLPTSGSIEQNGSDTTFLPPEKRDFGIVFQSYALFPNLTVEENIQLAQIAPPIGWSIERLYELFPRLGERRKQEGVTLSGGEQQMLAIARALSRDIKVLLLDEPYEGLAPVIVDEIEKTLRIIKEQGITTVIVEQNAVRALELADRAVILDTGSVVFDGSANEVLENEELRAEYLAI